MARRTEPPIHFDTRVDVECQADNALDVDRQQPVAVTTLTLDQCFRFSRTANAIAAVLLGAIQRFVRTGDGC